MLSVIITAYKEERTIGKAIEYIADKDLSGIGRHKLDREWELIVVAPDEGTKAAARSALRKLSISEANYKILTDKCEGKPKALNMCLEVARGDWLLLTDGDVHLAENAVANLVEVADSDEKIGGVSARPVAAAAKDSMLKYWGALLADAAHHKRRIDLTSEVAGHSQLIVRKRNFFPLSGYGMLIRNLKLTLPDDVLIDDAYLSYEIYNRGYKLAYAPEAQVYVKYPTHLDDYFKQKKRSTGGYVQLWKYGVVKPETKSRSFWRELEYFWFPIKYARTPRQLLWSLALYPTRLWLWVLIYWERKVFNKNFTQTWVRIESTK